jgi:methylenetetrahydrofolate reductase (NADPH)
VRVDERLARGGGPVVSFEFLPPRSVEAELAFWTAIEELAALDPAFVSVTCGAGGTTRDLTLAVVRRLARERGLEAVPHVTATGFARHDLLALLAEAAAGGAENVVALRGDPPRGVEHWTPPPGGVPSSLELISLAAEAGFCVLAGCYPEPHPDSRGWAADLAHLRAKVDAGARVLVTQLFFDNDDYRRFVDRLRAGGVEVPVLPGIIPIASIGQVERITALMGATIPKALRRELEARQDDSRAVAELGIAYATAQCAELLAEGAPGVHLYTFNRSPATRAIVSALRAQGALGSGRPLSADESQRMH